MKNILLSLIFIGYCSYVFAWGNAGHMTAGAVAYYYLKANNPDVLQKVLATAAHHPWFNTVWATATQNVSQQDKDVSLFMLISVYPDAIKKVPSLNVSEQHKWHFVDLPYHPNGGDDSQNAPSPNAEEKLDSFFTIFKTEAESTDRGIALCWIFHMIEDIHQPLHCATMIDAANPEAEGDLGGNNTFIKLSQAAKTVNDLHGYWDDLPTGTLSTIPNIAQNLLNDPQFIESNLPELQDTNLDDWIRKESYVFAVNNAYAKGTINGSKSNPTILSADYQAQAHTIAKKRLVLAGIRLAKKLVQLYS